VRANARPPFFPSTHNSSSYEYPTIALNCGAILRDAARDDRTAAALLADDAALRRLLAAVDAPSFEVASDAFATLRDLLTRHKAVVAARLNTRPPATDLWRLVFAPLVASGNYVTRRQSARLLGELLLERANAASMLRYVADPDNLKAAMVLLKDSSRSIQYEAFHVFKVFVANPAKPPAIVAILASNRDKLLKHLGDFQADRDDEQFKEEKAVVLREIAALGEQGGGG
jgi:calcium binding protein 39